MVKQIAWPDTPLGVPDLNTWRMSLVSRYVNVITSLSHQHLTVEDLDFEYSVPTRSPNHVSDRGRHSTLYHTCQQQLYTCTCSCLATCCLHAHSIKRLARKYDAVRQLCDHVLIHAEGYLLWSTFTPSPS